jgi:hypothetical protein
LLAMVRPGVVRVVVKILCNQRPLESQCFAQKTVGVFFMLPKKN